MAQQQAGFRRFKEEVVRARTSKGTEEWNAILDSWAGRAPSVDSGQALRPLAGSRDAGIRQVSGSPRREDAAGNWAKAKGHILAARFLLQEHGLSSWWAQAVTIRYEYERGLRE